MNAKFYELHNLITKIVEDDSWASLGLRATRKESEIVVGEYLEDSYIWVDGVCTDDQLDGVCALGIDVGNIASKSLSMLSICTAVSGASFLALSQLKTPSLAMLVLV